MYKMLAINIHSSIYLKSEFKLFSIFFYRYLHFVTKGGTDYHLDSMKKGDGKKRIGRKRIEIKRNGKKTNVKNAI